MKSNLQRILIAFLLLSSGYNPSPRDIEARPNIARIKRLLALADHEYKMASSEISPLPVMSSLRVYYCFPHSVEKIIECGKESIPILDEISKNGNLIENQTADLCIDVIKATHVNWLKPRRDVRSGILFTMVSATR